MHRIPVYLYEFPDLSEEVILGLPFIDQHGGLDMERQWVHINSIWMSRILPTPRAEPEVQSICRVPHIPSITDRYQTTIDDKGWYLLEVVCHQQQQIQPNERYWVEDAMNYDHLRVMEHPVTVEDEPSAIPGLMRVYARADDGHVVNLDPHKNICNMCANWCGRP